ncbi:CHAT domain-containing protein [Mycena latifolia]|nr:CHAT domain-containing protein [Mycena latifolia]
MPVHTADYVEQGTIPDDSDVGRPLVICNGHIHNECIPESTSDLDAIPKVYADVAFKEAQKINMLNQLVELEPPGTPDLLDLQQNLGQALLEKYIVGGDLKDLTTALENCKTAARVTSKGHSQRAVLLVRLADCFRDRYRRLGDLKDLETALQTVQEAVKLTPEGHSERKDCLWRLMQILADRYETSGDPEDLETALQYGQETEELTPGGNPDRSELLADMASCFSQRYERLGDVKDLEVALHKSQEAVDLCHERRWPLCIHATCLIQQYERLGDLKNLESALQQGQEAMKFTLEGGDPKDLEAALQKGHEAVELTPEGHPDTAGNLGDLATCFRIRYESLGDLKDLEAALEKNLKAVELTPAGRPNRAAFLQNLMVSLKYQYHRSGSLEDLEAALQRGQEAVQLTLKGTPDKPGLLGDLATCFLDRYQILKDPKDLESALQNCQEAVKLTPAGHPNRPYHLHNLAISFIEQYEMLGRWSGNLKDLKAAAHAYREAVKLTPEGHPDRAHHLQGLAKCFMYRYWWFKHPKDLEAVHTCYSDSFKITCLRLENSWTAALDWASFAEEFQTSYCLTAYSAAFNLLPEILWIGHPISVRHAAIHRLDIEEATSSALRTCIDLSRLTSAVEYMEQGIATVFQQMLQLKTQVDDLPPDEADEFRRLSSELYSGQCLDTLKATRVVNQRNQLLLQIRQQPGFQYFLLPKPYSVLRHAARGGPVVILNSHQDHCDGILIPDPMSDPVHVPLPNVTLDLLKSQRAGLKELLARCNLRIPSESGPPRLTGHQEEYISKPTQEAFGDLLTWLWLNVVGPVYQALELHGIHDGRLWWLPTGLFAGLPLHASSPTDQFIHSYTATLGSLLDAHAKKPVTVAHKMCVIGVTHTGSQGKNYLKGVEQEVQNIVSVIPKSQVECLEGEKATVDAVKQQLQDCSWVHLACHGTQDSYNPTKSRLLLYKGNLELETILQMPLSNAEFVFLAACQTATGDSELTNESFHLAGGFIAAGFQGAIGTLWSMDDQDGPVIAKVVYSHLFRNGGQPQVSHAAAALQLAVNELKKRKVPYERWIPFIHMGV